MSSPLVLKIHKSSDFQTPSLFSSRLLAFCFHLWPEKELNFYSVVSLVAVLHCYFFTNSPIEKTSSSVVRRFVAQISIAIIVTIAGTMVINIVEHISHISLHERFLLLTTFPRGLTTNDVLSDGESSILKIKICT